MSHRFRPRPAAAAAALLLLAGAAAAAAEAADPLAELTALAQTMAEGGPAEGGGSIRAKREVDVGLMKRLKDGSNLEAKVEAAATTAFPYVVLRLKVVQPAAEGSGAALPRGAAIVVVPKLHAGAGPPVPADDPEAVVNAGAFYLRRGDRVAVRLGERRGRAWEATYIERM